MADYKHLYEIAVRIGEAQSRRAIGYANANRTLRGVIWRALSQLRVGRADKARDILEKQLAKDQQQGDQND